MRRMASTKRTEQELVWASYYWGLGSTIAMKEWEAPGFQTGK